MARKSFTESIAKSTARTKKDIDYTITSIAKELFKCIVNYTPVGNPEVDPHPGQLVNSWQVGLNSINTNVQQRPSPTKTGPLRRIDGQVQRGIFLKDGYISFTNSSEYAWRAEWGGWNSGVTAGEGRWTGTEPYHMVERAFIDVASKYR